MFWSIDNSYGPASLRIYKRSNNKMITATLDSLKHLSPLKSVNLGTLAPALYNQGYYGSAIDIRKHAKLLGKTAEQSLKNKSI